MGLSGQRCKDLPRHARHLLGSPGFGLDTALLAEAAGGYAMAPGFLGTLARIAAPTSAAEIADYVLAPYSLPRSSAQWRTERVRRAGRGGSVGYQAATFVIGNQVTGLSARLAREILGRVAVAADFAGHDTSYVRARFEGNGRSVAYRDENAWSGLVMINGKTEELGSLSRPWPDWHARSAELRSELARQDPAERSA